MSSTVPRAKKIPKWKIEEVEYLAKLFREYPVFLLVDLQGYPTNQLQKLRKKLSKKVVFRVSKNKLILLAMEKAGINTSNFEKLLTGQTLLMFSKMNAFELAHTLEQQKSFTYFKPGDVTDKEIVIPEGNTGIPPGPMLSVFGKLKIPTKVQGNSIVVARDTVVARPGDTISVELASLLQKLDLPLKEVVLKIKAAYDHGTFIPGDKLKLDINEYEEMIRKAQLEAYALSVEIVWPEPEILERAIIKAYREALSLVRESAFISPDTIEEVIKTAYIKAYNLALELAKHGFDTGIQITMPRKEEKKKEKEEKKEEEKEEEEKEAVSEEELAEGLGAIFG